MTNEEKLIEILKKIGISPCKNCGRILDSYDVSWNNGNTEYGTGYSVIEIECEKCGIEGANIHSWYAPIETIEELCEVIEDEYKK